MKKITISKKIYFWRKVLRDANKIYEQSEREEEKFNASKLLIQMENGK